MEPSTIQSELIKSADFQNFRKIFGPEQKINTDKELFEWFLGYIYTLPHFLGYSLQSGVESGF